MYFTIYWEYKGVKKQSPLNAENEEKARELWKKYYPRKKILRVADDTGFVKHVLLNNWN